MPNILKEYIYKCENQDDDGSKLTRKEKLLSFYQIKYILDDRSCYGHVGNRDTITRKLQTDSFCAKSHDDLQVTFSSVSEMMVV